MKHIIGTTILIMLCFFVKAQTDSCTVAVDALKGTYSGECNKGKANGEGRATGKDSYLGTFKNGYPEGSGKYTWANGDYYIGKWKKGVREGKGEMHTVAAKGIDSLQSGFWKKDVYKGEYENPFKIYTNTTDINRVQVSKLEAGGATVTIEVETVLGGSSKNLNLTSISLVQITDMLVSTGSYVSKATTVMTKREITRLQGVIFPFRASLNLGVGTQVDFEIFESGSWNVNIPVIK